MDGPTRELVAYGLIGLIVVGGAIWARVASIKRRQIKLRRRGIKTYSR